MAYLCFYLNLAEDSQGDLILPFELNFFKNFADIIFPSAWHFRSPFFYFRLMFHEGNGDFEEMMKDFI